MAATIKSIDSAASALSDLITKDGAVKNQNWPIGSFVTPRSASAAPELTEIRQHTARYRRTGPPSPTVVSELEKWLRSVAETMKKDTSGDLLVQIDRILADLDKG